MNILLADNHKMTLEGYSAALKSSGHVVFTANTCEDVYMYMIKGVLFDVAVIDYSLSSFTEMKLHSGADCVMLIQQYIKSCKCVLVMAHVDFILIYSMYKKAKPSALVLKEDLTVNDFKTIVASYEKTVYLSNTAKKAIQFVQMKHSLSSDMNVQILALLLKGFKVCELSDIVGLSNSAIQKRISKMQLDFNVADTSGLIKALHAL